MTIRHLQEEATLVIPGIPVSMTASTPITSEYINAAGCELVECILFLAVSVAGATSVGRIEILAATDASGTSAEAVPFKDLYKTIGATTIADGTGIPTRIEQSVGTIPTAIEYYDTLAADGDKQQQFVIPIRTRSLPSGKNYVAIRFTAGSATARNGLTAFIRRGNIYGSTLHLSSIFA